jgi:DNA-binding NtrC family response regulator
MNHNNLDILVIDDDSDICDVLESSLRGFGFYSVRTVQTAQDFEKQIQDRKPDLIFSDINISGQGEGLELASKHLDIPFILMTGFAKYSKCGRNIIIEKPFETNSLPCYIDFALRNR